MAAGIELFDTLLRGAGAGIFGLLVLQAGLLARTAPGRLRPAVLALTALGMLCYLLVSSPALAARLGPAHELLVLLPTLNPFLIWWLGLSLFDDGFGPRPWHLIVLVATAGLAFASASFVAAGWLRGILVAGLYGHLLWVALVTARGDLVAERRHFRVWFLTASALLGLAVTMVEIFYRAEPLPAPVYPLHAFALLALGLLFALWIPRLPGTLWPPDESTGSAEAAIPAPTPDASLSAADRLLLDRLEAEMAEGLWRREGLTIGGLAAHLSVPEHRLRRLINGALGHRNFPAFINARRIAAARAALDDPARAHEPILSIAHEVGFASLGPFNRAFRQFSGCSPRDYRRDALEKAGEKPAES